MPEPKKRKDPAVTASRDRKQIIRLLKEIAEKLEFICSDIRRQR